MAEFRTEKRVVVAADAEQLAAGVARRLLQRLVKRSAAGKTTHIALAGGTIASDVLAAAGRSEARSDVDWSRVHVWWTDERFAARGQGDRNDETAERLLLARVGIPPENVHAIPGPDDGVDLDGAAAAYAAELARFGDGARAWPKFFVCFLGVGPDGHIASLFPDRAEIQDVEHTVLPVRDSPKPPADRVTMTRPVINSSRCVWLVLSGADKASALGLALAGASYDSVPAAGAKGRRRTIFFVDEDAAAQVPEDLIDPEF